MGPILLRARPLTGLTIPVHALPVLQCDRLFLNVEDRLRGVPFGQVDIPHPHQPREVPRERVGRWVGNTMLCKAERRTISELEGLQWAGDGGQE
jgi:hypothetical protein